RDHMVDERVIDGDTRVTFGQSIRCTLSVPLENLPMEHVLFSRVGGRLVLHPIGGAHQPIDPNGRGKLVIGDVTILYQDVQTAPATPRMRLPLSIRGTLADRIDKRLAVIVGTSIVLHVGIAIWAWATDVDVETLGMPPIAQTFHQDVMDVTLPDETKLPPSSEAGAATPVSPTQTAAPIVRPTHIVDRPPPSGDDALRLAVALTTDETGHHGTAGTSNRTPGADLQDQINDIHDRHLTIGSDTGFRADPTSRPGTTTGPIVHDNHVADTPGHHDEVPRDRFRLIPEPPTGTGVTPSVETVVGRINSVYMTGLQRCYQHVLAGGASSSGKVAISFTVNETGRVVEANAHGMGDIDACIHSQMLSWRFPAPKDAQGESTDAYFGVTLVLRAD
ncbi:MAG TPA: AgmX/PglI C-terminal domain-containing protein, partial [Kofleriaceae bacterium]|nr:AgmX/PglI C-terminal domain-containing protein [Kofleriaceae bacterium]